MTEFFKWKKEQTPQRTQQEIHAEVFANVRQAIESGDIDLCKEQIRSLYLIYNSPGDRSMGQVRRGFNAEELKLVRQLHEFLADNEAVPDEFADWFQKFAGNSEE